MKKVLFASLFAIMFVTGISSCGRCQVCKKPSEPEVRICKDDYPSQSAFSAAVGNKEAFGYDCKNAL